MPDYRIIDLDTDRDEQMAQTANLLVVGFAASWPDMESAREEVRECAHADNINRIAVDERGAVIGWIGGNSSYDGHVWELHPLVVHPDYQRRGVGLALVSDFEALVRQRGGLTVYLGTDDEVGQTSLANIDVYPDALRHLTQLRNVAEHPFGFYLKAGYEVVGMVPDANGFGKPDIMMAKRVGEAQDR